MRRTQIVVVSSALFLSGGTTICHLGSEPGASREREISVSRGSMEDASSESATLLGPHQHQRQPEPPPPPPALSPENEIAVPEPEERTRELSESAKRGLQQFEGVLPPQSEILRYPSSPDLDQLAVVSAVLEPGGHSRTVVVYREPEVTPLSLSVVESSGEPRVIATARLAGSYPVGIMNGRAMPVSVFDVTGDGTLEILAVTGMGASAGSVLQIFVLEGSNLRVVGEIAGHDFEVARPRGKGPTVVKARYQDEAVWRQLAWNGHSFDELP